VLHLATDAGDKLNRRLRKVTRVLGPVRELDVLLHLINELVADGRHDAAVLATVKEHVDVERERWRAEKAVPFELRRLAHKLERASAEVKRGGDGAAGRAWRWALDARIARRTAALRQAIDEAGGMYLPGRLHVVRIALKKLRYAVELSSEAGRAIDAANLRALKRWQDLLGRLHDIQVLIDRVRQVQASSGSSPLATRGGFDALVGTLEADCRQLHARYVRQRPAILTLCEQLDLRNADTARAAGRRAS
jgi:CHAD domain-containing protein